jgi:hypothetical protein
MRSTASACVSESSGARSNTFSFAVMDRILTGFTGWAFRISGVDRGAEVRIRRVGDWSRVGFARTDWHRIARRRGRELGGYRSVGASWRMAFEKRGRTQRVRPLFLGWVVICGLAGSAVADDRLSPAVAGRDHRPGSRCGRRGNR